jgi:hypothetical protein
VGAAAAAAAPPINLFGDDDDNGAAAASFQAAPAPAFTPASPAGADPFSNPVGLCTSRESS